MTKDELEHELYRVISDFVYSLQWLSGKKKEYDLTWGECRGCFEGEITEPLPEELMKVGNRFLRDYRTNFIFRNHVRP